MGAYQFPGRWNRQEERALYTSLEVGTAALEVLSYLDRHMPPLDGYSLLTLSVYCKQLVTTVKVDPPGKVVSSSLTY